MNPYYDSDKLGWDCISFDEPDLNYEYNTLCFWATKCGAIYSASDSGCSCPTPFEDNYSGVSEQEIISKLERIGSVRQAEDVFDAWNQGYVPGIKLLEADSRKKLTDWITERLKP